MTINWAALGVVTVVSIVTSLLFVVLLAGGIRLVSAGVLSTNLGQRATAVRSGGWGLLGLAAALVLFGIYLIVPIFH